MMWLFQFFRCAVVLALMFYCVSVAQGQSRQEGFFVAYEILEMAMNEFSNFAGEVGYRLNPKYQMRLTVMEVNLTERHLSSKWEAAAVDGENVEGYLRGYEAHIDRFFAGNWYVSGSVGYYEDRYAHTELDESLENRTFTVGSGIGYARANLFGIRGLYVNFDIPVRYYFNHIEKTQWGDTTIRPHVVVNNIWLFVGYKF
ncbi:hypothetical protein GQ464_010670 [Rhodocaloribacter litoris]|uniref:hypothetical protein n=1 Tax=Rhodocaloribacter litoris TaxID=2558931 RepID=UPI001422BB70|nr:hypothetical protein [Rhodocaloribacter litoris]QXD13924.1 hypothetical protein GQ464_010670 [Rhodocaloribacter litoris]